MNKSLIAAVMLATAAATGAALAQDQQADRKERIEQFNKRFADADANKDGKLTLDEAKAKMPFVASHFEQIDVDKKGYVTKEDVAKSLMKMRAAKGGAGNG